MHFKWNWCLLWSWRRTFEGMQMTKLRRTDWPSLEWCPVNVRLCPHTSPQAWPSGWPACWWWPGGWTPASPTVSWSSTRPPVTSTAGQSPRPGAPVLLPPLPPGRVPAVGQEDVPAWVPVQGGVFSADWRRLEPVWTVISDFIPSNFSLTLHWTIDYNFHGLDCFKLHSLKNSSEVICMRGTGNVESFLVKFN